MTRYSKFEEILDKSCIAYEYACDNFNELMHRSEAHVLYGPPSCALGAACPSQRMIGKCARTLREKTRRKSYHSYHFDSEWNLLFTRHYVEGRLDCTLLNFCIEDTTYACFFYQDTNKFYSKTVFSIRYANGKPICFAMADSAQIYVEYYQETNVASPDKKIQCNWFNYFPNRKETREGLLVRKDAEFGAPDSPVSLGTELYDILQWPPIGPR